jgi:tRNA splicing endonuclease
MFFVTRKGILTMTDKDFAILRAAADREEEGRIRVYRRLREVGAVIGDAVRRAEAAERLDVLLRQGR